MFRGVLLVGVASALGQFVIACDDGQRESPIPSASSPPPTQPQSPTSTSSGTETPLALPADPTALTKAAASGDSDAVRDLLARGAPVNARDATGLTPIMAASRDNRLEAARLLIAAGGDVNAKDGTQENAFSIAAINGHLEMLRLTIAAGADPNAINRFAGTALIAASDRGHVEIVRELLTTSVNVNHVNRLGWTALLEAVILGDGGPAHTEIVRLLLAAGADPRLGDGQGVTPLQHARNGGYTRIIALLEASTR